MLVFALWYWELDRGGPARRAAKGAGRGDFLFPQQLLPDHDAWSPGFVDYLYLAFTNTTALSPTDAMR